MAFPALTPPYVSTGLNNQEIIIQYTSELPAGLMTITIIYPNSNRTEADRIPTIRLGPGTVKLKLPPFGEYGFYRLVPKFPVREDRAFPPFQLRVLSSVEALVNVLAPDMDPYSKDASEATNAVTAALFAYLIQIEQRAEIRESDIQAVDQMLSQILPNMDELVLSFPQFICGQYINKGETFLHFLVRHKFVSAVTTFETISQTLEDNTFQESLSMKGFDDKTPFEVAEFHQLKKLKSMLKPNPSKASVSAESQKSGNFKAFKPRKQFDRIKKAIGKVMTSTDDATKQTAGEQEKSQDPSHTLLQHLKITALYSAEIIENYEKQDGEFGSISLNVGDIAFVTRTEDQYFCTGIVNNKYCKFPVRILKPISAGLPNQTSFSNEIPMNEELIRNNSREIRDNEDLENLVYQHKKFTQYCDEKQSQSAHVSRLHSYLSPVTRTSSVDSGLDEISNCSPLLKRRPPPIRSHKNTPLPKTPDEDTDDQYEALEKFTKEVTPTNSSGQNKHSPKSSPLMTRRMISTNDGQPDGQRHSILLGQLSIGSKSNVNVKNDSSKRSSQLSTSSWKSEDNEKPPPSTNSSTAYDTRGEETKRLSTMSTESTDTYVSYDSFMSGDENGYPVEDLYDDLQGSKSAKKHNYVNVTLPLTEETEPKRTPPPTPAKPTKVQPGAKPSAIYDKQLISPVAAMGGILKGGVGMAGNNQSPQTKPMPPTRMDSNTSTDSWKKPQLPIRMDSKNSEPHHVPLETKPKPPHRMDSMDSPQTQPKPPQRMDSPQTKPKPPQRIDSSKSMESPQMKSKPPPPLRMDQNRDAATTNSPIFGFPLKKVGGGVDKPADSKQASSPVNRKPLLPPLPPKDKPRGDPPIQPSSPTVSNITQQRFQSPTSLKKVPPALPPKGQASKDEQQPSAHSQSVRQLHKMFEPK